VKPKVNYMKKSEKNVENRKVNTIKRKSSIVKNAKKEIILDEDFIRARAEEIYRKRVENDEYGTPESDWYDAIESFKN
jgi:hypothetical protein